MADTTGVLVIGADAVLTGDVKGAKAVEIYGVIDGGVSAGDVTVRQGGKLNGWIKSDTSTVEGVLKGDVRVQQLITIRSTGSVEGNVKYGRLAMDEGAELTASVRNVPPSLGGDLDVTVKRGRTVKITPSDLKAIDPDDAPDALTFKVSNVVGGMITQSGAPGLSVDTFTQADLNAGRVYFAHDGSGADRASFQVVVSDDDGATSGAAQTVNVAVQA
ncbi:MAG: polymer-forming cytoskeletal protein [Hyphomicrobium sp.]|nr:polymer-forming cytoskeletal protein [Hyphomicrobium sp.]